MNYPETLDYLFSRLPMFQRIGSAAYKANLDNTHAICNLLDHPENGFQSIHIAGTNGKGSTSSMLAAILQSAGYKTGLYTSPHLLDFRERIRINGEMIPEMKIIDYVQKYKGEFDKIEPSFFEWTVGLAFDYFRNEKVDVAIIEVGLGGRLDSTNVITPLLSLITNIGLDHQALLGNTHELIAREKAGIIKDSVPVIIGERRKEIDDVFISIAKEHSSQISFCEDHYSAQWNDPLHGSCSVYYDGKILFGNLRTGLKGNYQLKNIPLVISAASTLAEHFVIKSEDIYRGIEQVSALTGFRGRWETLSGDPLIIADAGHNQDGIAYILNQLNEYKYDKLRFVLGVVNDKDIEKILSMLPQTAYYYFCKASIPRALDQTVLRERAGAYNLKGQSFNSVRDAVQAAKADFQKNDLIFIGGSTFTVADALTLNYSFE